MRSLGNNFFDSDKFLEGRRQGKRAHIFIDRFAKTKRAQTEIAMGFAKQFSDTHNSHIRTAIRRRA
jgi:hypothetical protein